MQTWRCHVQHTSSPCSCQKQHRGDPSGEEGYPDQPLSLFFHQGRDGLQDPSCQRWSSGCPVALCPCRHCLPSCFLPCSPLSPHQLSPWPSAGWSQTALSPFCSLSLNLYKYGGNRAFRMRWEETERVTHPHAACGAPSSYSCCDCI